ncbi:MAG: hypothetical protein ACD_22C00036G0003 [uncultured bacterium]|nr:MAG: hypothetical protein ACD_22C00036G0003 [uncultured bacterium]
MKKRTWFQSFLSFVIILGISSLLYLYTAGYRLTKKDNKQIDLTKTGMISAKSIPQGASVYLNGILITASNDTISGIEPGNHAIKIVKKGFVTWGKNIEIFPELVTDITAVLVSQSPRLEPLTNTGALLPSISPSLTKLAYFSKDPENPGVKIISLTGDSTPNLFRSSATTVLKDTPYNIYSDGTKIEWSPDEKFLIVYGNLLNQYYVVNTEKNTAEITTTPELVKKEWLTKLSAKREDYLQKVEIPENIKTLAINPESVWSPDEKKFLFKKVVDANTEYRVYNTEKPLPVGEKEETLVFTTKSSDPQPKVSWYADSFHLILTEGSIATNQRGSISIVRIDGTNKTELYNGALYSDQAFSSPNGDKIIISTSFKSGEQSDLYTVSLR